MRVGMNPMREQTIKTKLPPDIPVVAIITHLPNLEGYHEKRLEIVKAAVKSAVFNTREDERHLVVWDNGSCDELTVWLHSHFNGTIVELDPHRNRLILSSNIGKQNAINAIYSMYHGSIVAISDDDILHYPNWLQPQLDILEAFPDVGLVSGCTTRHYMKYKHLYGWRWAAYNDVDFTVHKTPIDWDFQHGESIEKEDVYTRMIIRAVTPCEIEYNDTKALIGGNHCQFVGYADTLKPFLPRTDLYMQPLYPFDMRVDDAKLLRLLTPERLTRHLGNILSDKDREEVERVCNG